jgi:hypothetical protein
MDEKNVVKFITFQQNMKVIISALWILALTLLLKKLVVFTQQTVQGSFFVMKARSYQITEIKLYPTLRIIVLFMFLSKVVDNQVSSIAFF